MDVADHLRLCQGEEVAIIQQIFARISKPLAPDISLCHAVGANGGTHRAIDDGDTLLQDVL